MYNSGGGFYLGAGFYVYDIGLLLICIFCLIGFGIGYYRSNSSKMLLGLLISLSMIFGDDRLLHSEYRNVNIIMKIIYMLILAYFILGKRRK